MLENLIVMLGNVVTALGGKMTIVKILFADLGNLKTLIRGDLEQRKGHFRPIPLVVPDAAHEHENDALS